MDIEKEIALAKENFINNDCNNNKLVEYFVAKKTYHTLAIMIFSIVTNYNETSAKENIYSNSYYKKFENENNPFNDEFASI